eukprot:m.127671 g.127671  ORF g.127671 m.127671 type:complete len:93 (+) comp16713_c1_seq1:1127-1405(+)
MTSAPWSANVCVANGPAKMRLRSTTLTSCRAPLLLADVDAKTRGCTFPSRKRHPAIGPLADNLCRITVGHHPRNTTPRQQEPTAILDQGLVC